MFSSHYCIARKTALMIAWVFNTRSIAWASRFSFRDVALDQNVRLGKHVKSMERSMISIRVAKIVNTDCSEASKIFASHCRGGSVPVDKGGVGNLVDERTGSCWLKLAMD